MIVAHSRMHATHCYYYGILLVAPEVKLHDSEGPLLDTHQSLISDCSWRVDLLKSVHRGSQKVNQRAY